MTFPRYCCLSLTFYALIPGACILFTIMNFVTSWTAKDSIWSAPSRNVKCNGLIGGLDDERSPPLDMHRSDKGWT